MIIHSIHVLAIRYVRYDTSLFEVTYEAGTRTNLNDQLTTTTLISTLYFISQKSKEKTSERCVLTAAYECVSICLQSSFSLNDAPFLHRFALYNVRLGSLRLKNVYVHLANRNLAKYTREMHEPRTRRLADTVDRGRKRERKRETERYARDDARGRCFSSRG